MDSYLAMKFSRLAGQCSFFVEFHSYTDIALQTMQSLRTIMYHHNAEVICFVRAGTLHANFYIYE